MKFNIKSILLESIRQSEVREKNQILYMNAYVWNVKNDIDYLICKVEIESQSREQIYGHQGGNGDGKNGRLGLTHMYYWYSV